MQKHLNYLSRQVLLAAILLLTPVFAMSHPGHDHAHSHMLGFAWVIFGILFIAGFFLTLRSLDKQREKRLASMVQAGR